METATQGHCWGGQLRKKPDSGRVPFSALLDCRGKAQTCSNILEDTSFYLTIKVRVAGLAKSQFILVNEELTAKNRSLKKGVWKVEEPGRTRPSSALGLVTNIKQIVTQEKTKVGINNS